MSADPSDDPDRRAASDQPTGSPTANFLAALRVRRNAAIGLLSGVVLAVAVYAYFVAIPALVPAVPARGRSPLLYLLLAFVVAVTTAMLVATALTGVSAVRLSRELD